MRTMGDRISRQPDTLREELVGRGAVSGCFLVGAIPNLARPNVAPILLIDLATEDSQQGPRNTNQTAYGSTDNQTFYTRDAGSTFRLGG